MYVPKRYVKEGYRYNPEGARQLLAEAGYPNGFKTKLDVSQNQLQCDVDLAQICKAYFADIGVDMEINVIDSAAFYGVIFSKEHNPSLC